MEVLQMVMRHELEEPQTTNHKPQTQDGRPTKYI